MTDPASHNPAERVCSLLSMCTSLFLAGLPVCGLSPCHSPPWSPSSLWAVTRHSDSMCEFKPVLTGVISSQWHLPSQSQTGELPSNPAEFYAAQSLTFKGIIRSHTLHNTFHIAFYSLLSSNSQIILNKCVRLCKCAGWSHHKAIKTKFLLAEAHLCMCLGKKTRKWEAYSNAFLLYPPSFW